MRYLLAALGLTLAVLFGAPVMAGAIHRDTFPVVALVHTGQVTFEARCTPSTARADRDYKLTTPMLDAGNTAATSATNSHMRAAWRSAPGVATSNDSKS